MRREGLAPSLFRIGYVCWQPDGWCHSSEPEQEVLLELELEVSLSLSLLL
jgi:hypothetical protein